MTGIALIILQTTDHWLTAMPQKYGRQFDEHGIAAVTSGLGLIFTGVILIIISLHGFFTVR